MARDYVRDKEAVQDLNKELIRGEDFIRKQEGAAAKLLDTIGGINQALKASGDFSEKNKKQADLLAGAGQASLKFAQSKSKKDKESKKRLIKLEKFQTSQNFDFTHVIIADYGLRLLQVAPLLPYYDIDPNIVRFVGTGAWDDEVFYDEPSLNGAIYPGIEFKNREELDEDYYKLYGERLLRISTLPFDLVGLLDFVINKTENLNSLYDLLNDNSLRFSGVDGSFYFLNNSIERDLSILKINKGTVELISKQK